MQEPLISIHPDARTSFARRANEILDQLQPDPHHGGVSPDEGWIEPYVSGVITSDDVPSAPKTRWMTDGEGAHIGVVLLTATAAYSVTGAEFQKLQKLAESIQRTPSLRPTASFSRTLELCTEWFHQQLTSASEVGISEYVLAQIAAEIEEIEVIIPIHELFLQQSLRIGQVLLKPVSANDITDWFAPWLAKHPEHQAGIEGSVLEWRKSMQGKAAAVFKVRAEVQRAQELAFEEVEAALSLLRIFSKGCAFARSRSYCTVLGKENVEKEISLELAGGKIRSTTERMLAPGGTFWRLDSEWMREIRELGLDKMSVVLISQTRSEFQQAVLDAWLLYSRCSLESSPEGKLIYVLSALESLLLRNSQEPIQENLAHRLAFLMTANIDERKQIIRTVKDTYSLRSRFVHHGAGIEDYEKVQDFLRIVWQFFIGLAEKIEKFVTREEFLEDIDTRRLGG